VLTRLTPVLTKLSFGRAAELVKIAGGAGGPRRAGLMTATTNCGGTTRSCAEHMTSSLVIVSMTSVAGAGRRPVKSRMAQAG